MNGRSTGTNIGSFSQIISEILDERGQVDVIYTDSQKAFNKIDHFFLLSKLERFGQRLEGASEYIVE